MDPCAVNTNPHMACLSFHAAQSASTIPKISQSKGTASGTPCPTRRLRISTHHTSLVVRPDPTSVTPMTRPRPSRSVRAIAESALPGIKMVDISPMPTKYLLRTFKVELANERILSLKLQPPPPSRLLRSEQWLLQSEAAVIEWLPEHTGRQRRRSFRRLDKKSAGQDHPGKNTQKDQRASDELFTAEKQLASYLPTLIKYVPAPTDGSPAFILFEPTLGSPISSLRQPLSDEERKLIDFQKGQLVQHIANIKSPNGKFGLGVAVFKQPQVSETTQRESREAGLEFEGTDSWRKTFHLLLEGILRDGEDLALTISYELIRSTFHKFGHLLDAVTTSRLVVYNADDDDIVLVSRSESIPKGRKRSGGSKPKITTKATTERGDSHAGPSVKFEEDEDNDSRDKRHHKDDDTPIKITGLRDWSSCIFGDPLFATVFSHPTPEFDRGFRQADDDAPVIKREAEDSSSDDEERSSRADSTQNLYRYDNDTDIIEDPDNAPTRILLYECYHATVEIVRQLYRPDTDSSAREMAARRRLVAALAKLDKIPVGESAGKRSRRGSGSGEDWPVKKKRGDTPVPASGPGSGSAPTASTSAPTPARTRTPTPVPTASARTRTPTPARTPARARTRTPTPAPAPALAPLHASVSSASPSPSPSDSKKAAK
ncbi:hypothetical protein F4777DRAFT_573671 [Nemania sp. FL0916]|nr:hypothetical protein F4777DRAFT_573671 [Nemania sp. FL0916]